MAIHVPKLGEELRANLRVLFAKAKAGEALTDGYGMPITESHDASAAIDQLVRFASLWEDHCRENGLHPHTGEKGGMIQPWPGFERREGVG